MNNNNNDGGNETREVVVDMKEFRKRQEESNKVEKSVTQSEPIEYEFHFYPTIDEAGAGEVVKAKGYVKFGPAFIAVLDGPDPERSTIVFAVATQTIRYVKQVSDGAIQGTLAL